MFDIEIPAPDGAVTLRRVGDGDLAAATLRAAGFRAVAVTPTVTAELDADKPGALGRMMDKLVKAGVVLHGQYSDHDNRKVLLVDDPDAARRALGHAP